MKLIETGGGEKSDRYRDTEKNSEMTKLMSYAAELRYASYKLKFFFLL